MATRVVVYELGEASANLLQPFWMLPTLAVLGLKARDIMAARSRGPSPRASAP